MVRSLSPDVAVVRSGPVINDTRISIITKSLSKKYSISVLGWNREGKNSKITDNYFVPLKLFNLKSPSGKASMVVFIPLFWAWTIVRLFLYRPKVIHACDLDTIPPCHFYKVLSRKKLVFDLTLRYAMAYIPSRYRFLYRLVNLYEEFYSRHADVLMTESEEVLKTFRKKPEYCAIVPNCPEDRYIDRPVSYDDNKVLTVVYTGMIRKNRGLENIISAMKDLNGVELVIAGAVIDQEVLNLLLRQHNVRYCGVMSYSDTLSLEVRADVIIALYDLNFPWNAITMPNKLLEAMMCGLPIITNVQSEFVKEAKCGMSVDYNEIDQIRSALVTLRDDSELRRRLGENGRKVFLQKYRPKIMEEKLYQAYNHLLSNYGK